MTRHRQEAWRLYLWNARAPARRRVCPCVCACVAWCVLSCECLRAAWRVLCLRVYVLAVLYVCVLVCVRSMSAVRFKFVYIRGRLSSPCGVGRHRTSGFGVVLPPRTGDCRGVALYIIYIGKYTKENCGHHSRFTPVEAVTGGSSDESAR